MTNYRRYRVAGGTYFFTVNLADRGSDLLIKEIGLLRDAVRVTRTTFPFHIDAWAVLPNHMHCVWTLPEGDHDFALRWRLIKTRFSKSLPLGDLVSASRAAKNERGIWQRRYWEHAVRDDVDYRAHLDYVHFNPVKHGLAENAGDWPYSSFQRAVAAGFYPDVPAPDMDHGARPG